MALVRWTPVSEMETLRREVDRLFSDWPKRWRKGRDEDDGSTYTWSPTVDIYEDTDELMITAELPGLDDKDVKVSVDGNMLTLSGERRFDKKRKEENYHRIEGFYGKFQRAFSLPANVDRDKIKARMDKGVLHVSLPKREESKPKQIEVKVGK